MKMNLYKLIYNLNLNLCMLCINSQFISFQENVNIHICYCSCKVRQFKFKHIINKQAICQFSYLLLFKKKKILNFVCK